MNVAKGEGKEANGFFGLDLLTETIVCTPTEEDISFNIYEMFVVLSVILF